MMTLILISLVEIILMLMFWLNRASNIVEATPEWLCIPAPTMETFAQVLSTVMSPPPMRCVAFFSAATALSASPRGTVKLMSFLPSRPVVCRMMSTLMFF